MIAIKEYILSDERITGKGVEDDPVRRVIQLFTKEGILIAEHDEHTKESWFTPYHGDLNK